MFTSDSLETPSLLNNSKGNGINNFQYFNIYSKILQKRGEKKENITATKIVELIVKSFKKAGVKSAQVG